MASSTAATTFSVIAMHMKLGSWVDIERIALRGDN